MAIVLAKLKSGQVYRVRVRDSHGRWHPCKSFCRKVDAERYQRELLVLNDKGIDASLIEMRNKTVQDYISNWIILRSVSDGWRMSQDQMIRDYIRPALGHKRLADVRPSDIEKLMAVMTAEKKGGQTRRHVYNILRKLFADAVENDWVVKSPVKRAHRPKVDKRHRSFLCPTEARKLLVHSRNDPYGVAIWLGILAGLRPGEIIALQWDAVDFTNAVIQIKRDFKKKTRCIENSPKQGDWGRAPMPPDLIQFLTVVKSEQRSGTFVAAGLKGGMIQYETLGFHLTRLCAEAQVTRLTPHELRHTATGMYLDEGATIEDVRKLLNHSSMAMTMTYIHDADKRLKEIAGTLKVTKVHAVN